MTLEHVSTHSRPKAAGILVQAWRKKALQFQHTAARRRLVEQCIMAFRRLCFNTQPPEGGWFEFGFCGKSVAEVSTHSRPKAAGRPLRSRFKAFRSFNTQPPEGGWHLRQNRSRVRVSFNTQPPEGGWAL